MRRWRNAVAAVSALALLAVAMPAAHADNPIVTHIYTADPAALVHDGRLYVYTGHDEASSTETNFVMRDWHVFSTAAASDEPSDWTDHGALLSLESFDWAGANAWASEVEVGPDGRYYWYVSVDGSTDPGWMNLGVAVGDSPLGPFSDAIGGPLISDSTPNSSALNIDPTVLVDDDGQVYMYWGSFWEPRMVRLKDNMVELDGPVMEPQGLFEFWEAPWMFKRNGVYYMAYASNAGADCVTSSNYACIRYATADNPMGPWTHRGVVLGQVSSTTNHPAIIDFNGQWYMIYHTAGAPGGGNFRRSVAIDELFFNPDGTMQQVVQTPIPVEPDPVPTDNVALAAEASASYTSPWETVTAINDGIDPPQSNDALNPRWGTWPNAGTQWVEYEWERPVRVNASDMFSLKTTPVGGSGGVQSPSTWSIQYWNGDEFVDVANPSGYGTALDQYNSTTFDQVTTTRLRATMQARPAAGGLGALEWKVYATQPAQIRPLHVPTLVGVQPALPETVTFSYPDGVRLESGAWWPEIAADELATGGTSFTLNGVADGSLTRSEATVYVRDSDQVTISALEEEHVVTVEGIPPALPPTVTAVYDDGSKNNVSTAVTWEEIDPALYAEPGTFTVAGTLAGTSLQAQATVTVLINDTTAPVTVATLDPADPTGESDWYVDPVSVALAATDEGGSGVAVTEYRLDGGDWTPYPGPVVIADDGEHVVAYRSVDELGNIEAAQTLAVNIDATSPATVTDIPPPNEAGWHAGPVTVTLSAADATSGVARVEYSLDGGDWTEYADAIDVSDDGVHAVRYRAIDVAGNAQAEQISVVRVDAADPSVTVSGVNDGQVYGDARSLAIAWEALDATSGVATVTAALDGEPVVAGAVPSLHEIPLGRHVLEVTGTDRAGHAVTTSVTFYTFSSLEDMAALVERFRADDVLGRVAALRLKAELSSATVHAMLGNTKGAIRDLEDVKGIVADPRLVTDPLVRDVLTRDADFVITTL